jgi:hypothetical protein
VSVCQISGIGSVGIYCCEVQKSLSPPSGARFSPDTYPTSLEGEALGTTLAIPSETYQEYNCGRIGVAAWSVAAG